jgi:hypothetical protein
MTHTRETRCWECEGTEGFVIRSDATVHRCRHGLEAKTWHDALEERQEERAFQMALPGLQSAIVLCRNQAGTVSGLENA